MCRLDEADIVSDFVKNGLEVSANIIVKQAHELAERFLCCENSFFHDVLPPGQIHQIACENYSINCDDYCEE